MFDQLFACAGFTKVLVLEDDMLVAPDFFAYFEATAKLLDQARVSSLSFDTCFRPGCSSYVHHEAESCVTSAMLPSAHKRLIGSPPLGHCTMDQLSARVAASACCQTTPQSAASGRQRPETADCGALELLKNGLMPV